MALVSEQYIDWSDGEGGVGTLQVFYDDANRNLDRFEVHNTTLDHCRIQVIDQGSGAVVFDETYLPNTFPPQNPENVERAPGGAKWTNNKKTKVSNYDIRQVNWRA